MFSSKQKLENWTALLPLKKLYTEATAVKACTIKQIILMKGYQRLFTSFTQGTDKQAMTG